MSLKLNLSDLVFPIYVIGTKKPITDLGVSYFVYGRNVGDTDEELKLTVLDDKTVPGDTLAKRRLYLKCKNVPLKKLTKAIFFISDFIKIATPKIWFIDSKGNIFNYTKSKSVPLLYYKIKSMTAMPQGGQIVEVEGIPYRFKTLFKPTSEVMYAGVLKDGMEYILYGLYDKKYKNSVRRI